MRCSEVEGSECSIHKKCEGETPPSAMTEEGLIVVEEKYGIVDCFCYLGGI